MEGKTVEQSLFKGHVHLLSFDVCFVELLAVS